MSAIYILEFVHDGGAKFSFVFTDPTLAERAIYEAQEHGFRCREWCQRPTVDADTVNRFPEICREAIERMKRMPPSPGITKGVRDGDHR